MTSFKNFDSPKAALREHMTEGSGCVKNIHKSILRDNPFKKIGDSDRRLQKGSPNVLYQYTKRFNIITHQGSSNENHKGKSLPVQQNDKN